MRKIAAVMALLTLVCDVTTAEEVWNHYANGNELVDAAVYKNTVWCATRGSVVRWNVQDSTWTQYTTSTGIYSPYLESVVTDRNGGVWVTYDSGNQNAYCKASYFDGISWTLYDQSNSGLPLRDINDVFPDSKGNVWFGVESKGIIRFDGTSWETYFPITMLNKYPQTMAIESSGKKWIVTSLGVYTISSGGYHTYTSDNGLISDTVRCISIGPSGAVWFGTTSGISVFDGNNWKSWIKSNGLVNNGISDIAFAPDGAVWFATDGGVSRFDGTSWESFTVDNGLIADKSAGITVDKAGWVWVCHPSVDQGVSCYDGVQWKWYATWNSKIAGNTVYSVASDNDGVVWFATDMGVCSFDGSTWKPWTIRDGLASNRVSKIMVDDSNRKWFLYKNTEKAGVSSFDGKTFTTFTEQHGLLSNIVYSIAFEGDNIWFCTSKGLCRFDGSTWKKYPENNRLISDSINSITEDVNGTLWFATDGGLTSWNSSGWYTWTMEDGLPSDEVLSVAAAPDGTVWMVANSMLVSFNGTVFTRHPVDNKILQKQLKRVSMDDRGVAWTNAVAISSDSTGAPEFSLFCFNSGAWKEYSLKHLSKKATSYRTQNFIPTENETGWVATHNGLLRYTPEGQSLYRINCPSPEEANSHIKQIIIDQNNIKWFLEQNALYSFNGAQWTDHYTDLMDLASSNTIQLYCIMTDSYNVKWLYSSHGLLSYDDESWKLFKPDIPIASYPVGSFPHQYAIAHKNVIWIKSYANGVVSFDGKQWKKYTTADGLISDDIISIAADNNDVMWFGAEKGVSSFDGVTWKTYSTTDALAGDNVRSIVADANNVKWFGTDGGVSRFNGEQWQSMLTNEKVWDIIPFGSNKLWAKSFTGVHLFDGSAWKSFPLKNYSSNIALDNNDILWATQSNYKMITCDGDSLWENDLSGDFCIGVDRNNFKWFYTTVSNSNVNGVYSLDDRARSASGESPRQLTAHHNYPNPFNAKTTISFDLYSYGWTEVKIYNLLGQKVRTLVSGILDAGGHNIPWDGTDDGRRKLSSGIYFYRIAAQGQTAGDKMLYLK